MMRRWTLPILFVLLGFLITLSALIYGLAGTTPGTRLLLDTLIRYGHMPINYQRLHGSLLDGLDLYGIDWQSPTARLQLQRAELRWKPLALFHGQLKIERLSASHIRVFLPEHPPPPDKSKKAGPPLHISFPISVDLKALVLNDITVEKGRQHFKIDSITIQAQLHDSTLHLSSFRILAPQGSLLASGSALLHPPYTNAVEIEWHISLSDGARITRITGQGKISGDIKRLRLNQTITAPFPVILSGDLSPQQQSVDLMLQWQRARWPLEGAVTASSPDGRLHMQGTLASYSLSLRADLAASTRLPAAGVTFKGTGHRENFDIADLQVNTLGGRIQGIGQIGMRPKLHWKLQLSGKNLDPGKQWADMRGNIGFLFITSGTLQDALLKLDVLKGTLHGAPLTAQLNARWRNEILHLVKADIHAGDGRLSAKGTVGHRNGKLQLSADFPHLSTLLPSLHGGLHGAGKLSGEWLKPRIEADFKAQALGWQNIRIGDATLTIRPLGGDTLQADLVLLDLQRGSLDLRRVQAQLSGDLQRQRLRLQVAAGQGGLTMAVQGVFDHTRKNWQGRLTQLTLRPNTGAGWQLTQAATLSLSPHAMEIGQTCLHPTKRAGASICLQMKRTPLRLAARADIRSLPLTLLGPWLPAGMKLTGEVNGQARLSGPMTSLNGQMQVRVSQGRLGLDQKVVAFAIPVFQAHLQSGAVNVQASMQLHGQHASLNARLAIGVPDKAGMRPLAGGLQANVPALSALQAFVPQLHGLGGAAGADFIVTGSLQKPQIYGKATLSHGTATVLATGTHIRDLNLLLNLPRGQDRLLIEASADSGKGRLQISGNVSQLFAKPKLEAKVTGQDFLAIDLPEVEAEINPNLTISADSKLIKVRGEVTIPQAEIRVQRLPPHTVGVSSDAIIVGEQEPNAPSGPLIDVVMTVILGHQVHIDAMGLKADLRGELQVRQQGNRFPSAYGSVNIVNGTYAAYGLDLTLSRGVLNFAGPVNTPGLDFVAERQAGSVTAKLSLTGTLQTPHAEISSDPPLSQADALSYLLTGHGLNGASKNDTALLLKAIYSLKMGGGGNGGILNEVKKKTGLNEIGVQGGDTLQQSALVLGAYLTPKLYVKLITGLFQPSNTLSLSYELSRHLSIEVQSGASQALSFLYQIDFGKR